MIQQDYFDNFLIGFIFIILIDYFIVKPKLIIDSYSIENLRHSFKNYFLVESWSFVVFIPQSNEEVHYLILKDFKIISYNYQGFLRSMTPIVIS